MPLVYFAEPDKTNLWDVWAEQHATYTRVSRLRNYLGLFSLLQSRNSLLYTLCSAIDSECIYCIKPLSLRIKMKMKIGVIFMPLSNPMCHFKDTADFTRLQSIAKFLLSDLYTVSQVIHRSHKYLSSNINKILTYMRCLK